ncbi:selenocysteine-specific translation elongation factor [Actinobacillus succinogenes]|uniref:Selenocysteine-specific translation elongation factor n=1 Tax=Actinobacillus succinogenes (strain ATCC 55618 / DSM 22257 / CCUG 43843 / 130Z) TaxID=339671 RepID=A6VLH2_ACTSZ|nr:selenocysteine-specific translation elongation factor [Actinobacillus succinogenes]ABR73819.1 selenocysteine-specific translation elongation factor [Actinobacillus succinogenes 130Z]PHI39728.1 selenocysteine-specific translation elongation factor [Actinobacillus succinogenes]
MIIVTSGHVDHGKTALLQALTGVSTAHLPEEKKRGMTIDLGYAYLSVKDSEKEDKILGFIDVPGHEKFLANMLAGLGGIYYAMLIVAADEGVRAQTEEHLAILRLLQIDKIMVVITKADRADSAQIDDLRYKIKQNYPFLAECPFFVTSAATGQGIAELREFLTALPNPAEQNKPFRYAIDRIFTVKGAGTVVTGTAFSGKVEIDDELYFSNGAKVRVKNIHAQNRQNAEGLAGQRLALNINADFDRALIERGDWLFSQAPWAPTDRFTVVLNAETRLNETQPVHVYHAASHVVGKLGLLTAKSAVKTSEVLAEVLLDKPLFLTYGDKLILRSGDNKQLLAGARVLDVYSPKRHKRSEARLNFLTDLQHAQTAGERLVLYLQSQAVNAARLMWIEQLTASQLDALMTEQHLTHFQEWCFNRDYQQTQIHHILTALEHYHEAHSDQAGLGKARLYRIAALQQPEELIYHLIGQLLADGRLQQSRGWLHLPTHRIQFNEAEQALWQQVAEKFAEQNGQALWVRELATALNIEETLMRNFCYKAGNLGYLTAVVKDRFFLTETVYRYAEKIKALIEAQGAISVNQLRDELPFGRKLTVQLAEYFDRCGFLRRKGNVHLLRDRDIFAH